jgi:four helix bundle protein
MNEGHYLDHEALDVYRVALEFVRLVFELLREIPRSERDLRTQLKRAAFSIPLNIAEGTGKTTTPDRARFYATARGSSLECGSILDVCALAGWGDRDRVKKGKELLGRTVAMLTKMSRW